MNFGWSEHMHVTLILWSSAILVTAAMTRGSILPALMSAMPSGSKVTFLFFSSSAPSGESVPPCPSWPNCDGSTAWCLAPPPAGWSARSAALAPDEAGCGSTGAAAGAAGAGAAAAGSAAATGAAAGAGAPAGCGSPTSTAAFGTLCSFGRSVALGRSFASSLMSATFFCASSAALVSGDSCLVIFSAAASAADFGFATAGSAAAAAPAPPLASAAAAGSPAAAGASPAATGSAAAAGAAPLPPAALGSTPASTPPIASTPLAPPAPAGGAADGGGGADRLPPRLPIAGQVDAAQDVADRLRDVVEVRGDVLGELHDADALHRRRHHHAGEARLGLPHVQGHHRLARAELHLLRELLEPGLAARLGRVAAEARAERGVDEQALDQLRGDVGFSGGHGYPLKRSTSGFPSTTKTGMKSASQSVPSTTCTTHDGANWDMIGS